MEKLRLPTNVSLTRMFPKLQQERANLFTSIFLTLAASICFGVFAINPTLNTIADLQRQLDDQRTILQKVNEKISALFYLQKSYTSISPDIPLTLIAIPKNPDAVALVGYLQGLAKQDNVTLTHVQIFPIDISQVSSTNPIAFTFNINTDGAYQNTLNLLTDITKMSRLISIDSAAMSKTINNTTRLDIKGRAYSQKTL
jgi:Tfp pilus assembly protein PilO